MTYRPGIFARGIASVVFGLTTYNIAQGQATSTPTTQPAPDTHYVIIGNRVNNNPKSSTNPSSDTMYFEQIMNALNNGIPKKDIVASKLRKSVVNFHGNPNVLIDNINNGIEVAILQTDSAGLVGMVRPTGWTVKAGQPKDNRQWEPSKLVPTSELAKGYTPVSSGTPVDYSGLAHTIGFNGIELLYTDLNKDDNFTIEGYFTDLDDDPANGNETFVTLEALRVSNRSGEFGAEGNIRLNGIKKADPTEETEPQGDSN
ncbi:MAG: hypothetical protein ABIB47_01945 [Candidatus Woesearchaeota archaeon]